MFETDNLTRRVFQKELADHELVFIEGPLTTESVSQAQGAEIIAVFINSVISPEVIASLHGVQLIITLSTGYDHINVPAAKTAGIKVATIPGYGAQAVAEHTFAILLSLSRKIFEAYHQVREEGDFDIAGLQGFDLAGKTLGVVGTGRIGMNVIRIAKGFGMNVLACDPLPKPGVDISYVALPQLFQESDIITLHAPRTSETKYLLDDTAFSSMKDGVYIVNTARGELIETAALLKHLQSGKVAGAALDVLENEHELKEEAELISDGKKINNLKALLQNHVLIDLPNVIITPHIAFHSKEADQERVHTACTTIQSFISGEKISEVLPR